MPLSSNSDVVVHIYNQYYPPDVKRVIASGGSAWIGEVDDSTVLKYPLAPGLDLERLKAEQRLLELIGPHPRIIGLKGVSETGILLERAVKGNLANYLLDSESTPPSILQRLSWCQETAEAVAYIHTKRVLHCDIQPTNLLLDKDLHIKLSDFQGRYLSEDGDVVIDGWSAEPCRFSCPRDEDICDANIKTDIFALGCTIYFIMMGHAPFPDISEAEDGWREKVEERFRKQEFPQDCQLCGTVTSKCWLQKYESAEEIVRDLASIQQGFGAQYKREVERTGGRNSSPGH